MGKYFKSRICFVLLLSVCFFMGVLSKEVWKVAGYEVQGAEKSPVREDERKNLPITFYDDKGRKVIVRRDGVLQLEDIFRMEIPLGNWGEGQCALVEIRVIYGEGTEEENSVHIQRKIQE